MAFQLDRPARVKLEALRTALHNISSVWEVEYAFPAGKQVLEWKPDPPWRPAPP